ncbi:AAEL013456-PA [Aedes aegypti]|uniref:AAEL013456-PA n=1 Tax=Aedes aegypti TaxID=7159 RepID=Q16J36_AEDAE|nr:AAEL013456-PA [Aedes aegypti]
MTRHDKIASRKYQCQHCGKPFASAFAVKYHELTHTQKDVYKCSMCPKSFQNASNLNRHYEGIHKGDKKYQCDICEKRFQMPHILATHKRIHTGERPFGCEQCGKRFSDPSTLWRHRKNVCKE